MENSENSKKGDTIKNTFYNLLQIRGIYKIIEIDKARVSRYRKDAEYGKFPEYETMHTALKKAGYKIVQEELWIRET